MMRREDGLGFSQDKFGSRIAVLQRRSQSYRFASAIFFAALHESGNGRYCCKSPKLPAANFSAVKKSDRRPQVNVASITLPRSPASLSSGDEVPHIFTLKSRVQPKEILITSAKRLLQQNLHEREVPRRPAKV